MKTKGLMMESEGVELTPQLFAIPRIVVFGLFLVV